MGVIKALLGIVILVAIVVFGYWLYATYTIASADDEMWIKVNSNLPAPLREWSCAEVNHRIQDADAPEGCAEFWQATATDIPAESQPEAATGTTATTTPPANN